MLCACRDFVEGTNMRRISKYAVLVAMFVACVASLGSLAISAPVIGGKSGVTMWQLPESSPMGPSMSYVIRTENARIVVVDGGFPQEALYLRGFLAAMGNRVDAWIVTHPHPDHAGVLNDILKAQNDLKIDRIYESIFDRDWYTKVEPEYMPFTEEFYANVTKSGIPVTDVQPGMKFVVDGVRFTVLSAKNPEFTGNAYNESSLVVKMIAGKKSVLFLGDLGVEGGKKLLVSPYAKYLKSDYVQMAHHGQTGVLQDVYKAVSPKYCLTPAPEWLWNNDSGKGVNTGPWLSLVVRKWMEELHVKKNYPAFEGLLKVEL